MAQVSNLKGLAITNRDATPPLISDSAYAAGGVKEAYDYVTTLAADSIGSIYRLCQVPSNSRLTGIVMQAAAMGTSCTFDVGAYYPTIVPHDQTKNASEISKNFFADGIDVSAAVAPTEEAFQTGTYTMDKQQMPLWKALGLAADPNCPIDICIYVKAATVNAALVSLKCKFVT